MNITHRSVGITALALLASLAQPALAQVSRTPWQMHEGQDVIKLSTRLPSNGALPENDYIAFQQAEIPAEGAGWVPAPNPDTIGFGSQQASRIAKAGSSCLNAVDYTYFQTFVDVPAGTQVDQFKIAFQGMDDASRISIFNSANPGGKIVEGSYVLRAAAGASAATTDLKELVVTGRNRIVITQVDWCPGGNELKSAQVHLNGSSIVASAPAAQAASAPPAQSGSRGLLLGDEVMRRASRYSMEGHYLVFQQDGNLCVYRTQGDQFVWCINNDPNVRYSDSVSATMTREGQLVVADADGGVVWQAPENNPQPNTRVLLTRDGVFELRSPAGAVLWSSR